jgi:hypothetical protein
VELLAVFPPGLKVLQIGISAFQAWIFLSRRVLDWALEVLLRNAKVEVIRRAVTLVLLGVLVCCIHIKADVWPLVLTGDAIPNTANFRFIGFSQPVIDTSGTVAFNADFVDPATGLMGNGIFKITGGQVTPVMLEGQPLPDVPGRVFGEALYGPWINNNGDILFAAFTNEPVPPQVTFYPIFVGIFLESGGTLRRIADYNTPVPGAFGQTFVRFNENMQINDRGDIAFFGEGVSTSGPFLESQGVLQPVSSTEGNFFSLNNQGAMAFISSSRSLNIVSGGTTRSAPLPATVPGTNLPTSAVAAFSFNDNGDVAYVNASSYFVGRGSVVNQNAVVDWSGGSFQKVVAVGDPVPGLNDVSFEAFSNVQTNQAQTVFLSEANPQSNYVIGSYQNGQLSTVAAQGQYIDEIGPLDNLGNPAIDTRQGSILTFAATAAGGANTGIYAASTSPQFTLRFPHIADGGGGAAGGWRTTFIFANRSAAAASATISFYGDNGNALNLAVGGASQSQTSIVVPALGVAEVQTQGGGPLTTGWALVQSNQNLTGIGIFGLLDGSGNSISEVGVPASLPLSSMSVFVQNGSTTSTGIALANPNATAANVTLTLKDSNSVQLAQKSLTIPPMAHSAAYATELFSSIPPGEFQGKIEVLSTQPLAGLTLRQRGSVFTSLPVIP